jgi:hypothetical protein
MHVRTWCRGESRTPRQVDQHNDDDRRRERIDRSRDASTRPMAPDCAPPEPPRPDTSSRSRAAAKFSRARLRRCDAKPPTRITEGTQFYPLTGVNGLLSVGSDTNQARCKFLAFRIRNDKPPFARSAYSAGDWRVSASPPSTTRATLASAGKPITDPRHRRAAPSRPARRAHPP